MPYNRRTVSQLKEIATMCGRGDHRDRLESATASNHAYDRSVYIGHVSGGGCRSPQKFVGEARRRHVLDIQYDCTELTITEYLRVCRRGIDPRLVIRFIRFPGFVPVHLGTTPNLTFWGTRFTNPYSGVECLVGHQRDRDSRMGHARYSRPCGARRDVVVTRFEA